ncbi:hypothetical protein [Nitrosomonas eutropha]|uniref:hypothetical protein n=1 Tax=Nitrosomonas eutropha TaxID=916 RepID=UPI0008B08B64|nr:hypothetical protein [Nitrosomonas eutropha]SEJ07674.1 hypothetical protein SAMN05216318_12326 [Nitrosomonas eutropha]
MADVDVMANLFGTPLLHNVSHKLPGSIIHCAMLIYQALSASGVATVMAHNWLVKNTEIPLPAYLKLHFILDSQNINLETSFLNDR